MMTYENFKRELSEQLPQKSTWGIDTESIRFYEDGFQAPGDKALQEFVRKTNIRYHKTESDVLIGDYVTLKIKGKPYPKGNAYPENLCRFELNYLYNSFKKQGWGLVWRIIRKNIAVGQQIYSSGVLEQLECYEVIREKLIIRPLNYTNHRYDLEDAVYKKEGDIALVLYAVVYDNEEQGLGTIRIEKTIFNIWGRSLEEVWNGALINSFVLSPPRIYMTLRECCNPEYERGTFMTADSSISSIKKSQVPTVTTVRKTNGAIALFYPGVRERIAQLAGGSYYVAFTSIHEAKIHCKGSVSPVVIRQNLRRINKVFDPEETLSNKVYYYDAEKGSFTVYDRR